MASDDIFIIHPATTEQATALKAFVKALKMKFEIATKKAYDPEFIDMVLQGDKDFDKGNFKVIKTEELWK